MRKSRIIFIAIGAATVLLVALLGITATTAKKRAESLNCASSVTSICLAARLWAEDHAGMMPTDFVSMSNEVMTPKILSCLPSRRTRTSDWSAFTPENCTYEIVGPGIKASDTNTMFLRCRIHRHVGYSDCTVFDGIRRRTKFG